jgi:three-Cys-motif partner protein
MPRQKDSDPEKWEYRQHTRVKHAILESYLPAWLRILGSWHIKVVIFDGFAGRGRYVGGEDGSPVIVIYQAADFVRKRSAQEVICVLIEKDEDNFANLVSVLEEVRAEEEIPGGVKVYPINSEFSVVIDELLDSTGARLAPSFFFIDPFGFTGVPFRQIRDILSIPRTEVLFTFMQRDISRFITHPELGERFTELFGTTGWQGACNLPPGERPKFLRELYRAQLHDAAGVKYTTLFKVVSDDRKQTLYHLIHATNHFKGLDVMKEVMYRQGKTMPFAYLGPGEQPKGQLSLFNTDQENINALIEVLPRVFAGRTLTYDQVREETWEYPYLDTHYRAALKQLEKDGRVAVTRVTSKTKRGLSCNDRISFPQ